MCGKGIKCTPDHGEEMRTEFCVCLAWLALQLGLMPVGAADASSRGSSAEVLASVQVSGPLRTSPVFPVYAILQDALGNEYMLTVCSEAELKGSGAAYRVLDSAHRADEYVLVRPGRKDAEERWWSEIPLLDDGVQRLVRASVEEAQGVAEAGFLVYRLPGEPIVWPVEAPVRTLASVQEYDFEFRPDSRVELMMAGVQQADLVNLVRQLSGDDPMIPGGNAFAVTNRNTKSTVCIGKATDFAREEFEKLGLNVWYQSWTNGGYTNRNVIAVQPGGARSNEVVYVVAHIDDMPSAGRAPGGDDNASGTATVLDAARILSQHSFERTLKYALFTGEEQGLFGSLACARQAKGAGEQIVAVLDLDMLAWDNLGLPRLGLHTRTKSAPGYSNDLAIATTFTNVIAAYGLSNRLTPIVAADAMNNSDHSSFWNYGYAAIMACEDYPTDFNPYYHTPHDSLSRCNLKYFCAFAQAAIGTAAQLARPAGETPFEVIEVANSDWRVGSPIGAGTFYARHDWQGMEFDGDTRDVIWTNVPAPTNAMLLKICSKPYGVELQTDSRPFTSETIFSGKLAFVDHTSAGASCSNALRFRFISPPLSNRVYAARIRVDGAYTADGLDFEIITNIQQVVVEGNGFLKLPTLTNLVDGAVYGNFDLAARFLDRTSGFSLRVDSAPGQNLLLSAPAQTGAVVTDLFEVSTNLGDDGAWVPWQSFTNYVGAASSAEFEAGWTRVAREIQTTSWEGEPGAHYLRVKRSWGE